MGEQEIKLNVINSDDISLSIIHICCIITCVMFCCAETTLETLFLINIAFNGRAVPGPYFRPIWSPVGKS